jgi:hypothetical protein
MEYPFVLSAINLLLPVFRHRWGAIFSATLTICAAMDAPAQAPYDNRGTAEAWAWARIREGTEANFNVRCRTPPLDPRVTDDLRWTNSCRQLSATFLVDMLTRAPWRDQVPISGVRVIGARIVGHIDLQNAKMNRALLIARSRIENSVSLFSARTDSVIHFVGSRVVGTFDAAQLHSEMSLIFDNSEFKQWASLNHAKIDGLVAMQGATFAGDVNADSLQVGAHLFMRSTEQNRASFKGVNLNGAKVTGNVEIIDATFDGDLTAGSLQVGGSLLMRSTNQNKASFKAVNLTGAKVTSNVEMVGATFDGDLIADSLQVGGNLYMRSTEQNRASFKAVNLTNAKVTSNVEMTGATFDGDLAADLLQVEGSLSMNKASFKGVKLNSAKVTGYVDMDGATFDGDLIAASLQVGGNLYMRSTEQNRASFKAVNLTNAKVTSKLEMTGATFDGDLAADLLQVEGSLSMNKASFKGVKLNSAKVTGYVDMDGATFDKYLNAQALRVEASLFMREAIGAQPIGMIFARINSNLDISGSTLAELNVAGAVIGGELRLGVWSKTPNVWRSKELEPGNLILTNTRIAVLSDAENAWPSEGHLRLDGFSFERLGGFDDTAREMRKRTIPWWDNWVRRDPAYSPTPYEQLAAALVAAGDRDGADQIRFLGRVRQRETESNWWSWIFTGILQWGTGFGIGDYTFRVLYWVIFISVVGAVYLWTCVPAAHTHGPIWCLGASLTRLLPVIEVNKEFTDFFKDPGRKRLTGLQSFVFSLIGLLGWLLGLILLAAISGLTQKH